MHLGSVQQLGGAVVGCTQASMGNITCMDERRGSHVHAYTYQRIRMAHADAAGC